MYALLVSVLPLLARHEESLYGSCFTYRQLRTIVTQLSR